MSSSPITPRSLTHHCVVCEGRQPVHRTGATTGSQDQPRSATSGFDSIDRVDVPVAMTSWLRASHELVPAVDCERLWTAAAGHGLWMRQLNVVTPLVQAIQPDAEGVALTLNVCRP